jgi:Amidohydrolase
VSTKSVSRVVALEEAFLHPRVWELFPESLQRKYQPVRARLSDVGAHPARFAAFAMLPTQSPAHAADELERAVRALGFKGALINGHTNGHYLDDPAFDVLLSRAECVRP